MTVRVAADDDAHLVWLEEFLSPQLEVGGQEPWSREILFVADRDGYEETLRRGPAGGEKDAFALDSSVIRLPLWNDPEGRTVLHDERFWVFYTVEENPPRITITARDNHIRGRTPLMRVIRELAMNHGRRLGGFFIHGSSFEVGGNGVILAGPKHSGKTTLLINALRNARARYLANDRVMVRFDGDGTISLRGIPSIVTIREPTTDLFPGLYEKLTTSGFHFRENSDETRKSGRKTMEPWENGKYGLNPVQFCRLLGATPVAQSRAKTLVFPRLADGEEGIRLGPIEPGEAAGRLREALFGIDGLRKRSEVFVPHEEGDDERLPSLESLCREFASTVRCFDCLLGPRAYEGDDAALHFVDAVLGRPGGGGR